MNRRTHRSVHRLGHRLILASAGTGKTFQLTGRFLELLYSGVEPARILATTFTRKAAGEIFDRLLRRQVEAIEDSEKRRQLCEQIGMRLEAPEIRARLARLVRRLDCFRVRTLDAFFVHLARLFAFELGLPADWTIVEEADDEALRRAALALVLAEADRMELLGILRELQPAEASRSIERVLLGRVKEGRDAFLDSHPEAWERVVPPRGPSEHELARARTTLERMPIPTTKRGTANQTWQRGRAAFLERCASRDWEAILGEGLGEKVLKGDNDPRRRGSVVEYSGHAIPSDAIEAIRVFLRQAAHILLAGVARENRSARTWLERFERAYERSKAQERAYRFEDLPKHLHPREENRIAERDLVWYRLDGRIDHLLLDEFQDTSPVQWRILDHLAAEILADRTGERTFFCVGDVKQSIYGWREAEPRLLERLSERYPVLEPEPLVRNHRSSRVILETVERVFGRIGENAALADPPERLQAARDWQARFDVPQAAKALPGAAWLLEAGETSADGNDDLPTLRLAAQRARQIREEAPRASVGILLRRNEHLSRMIYLLRNEGIRASDEGGNPLTDSPAVLHFLSLLHLADHPSDSAAAFHVATSPLAPLTGLTPDAFRAQMLEAARVVRRRRSIEGYGSFTSSFREAVEAGYGTWDRKRFDQLVDLAYAYDDRAGLRTDPFVDHVRITKVEDPSSLQVKVMTVHMAKGLEFDAVILPELDLSLSLRENPLLTLRPDPAGLLQAVSQARSKEVCLLDERPGGLRDLWADREARETRESLCLLYVAMTRAKHRLDLIVQHRKDPTRASNNFASILRATFGLRPAGPAGVLWAHPENDDPWFPRPTVEPSAAPPSAALFRDRAPRFRTRASPHSLQRRAPSAEEGAGRLDPRDLLRSPRSAAFLRGRLIHLWMKEVEWLDGFRLDDARLLEIGRTECRDPDALGAALEEFRAHLDRPNVRAVLSRSPVSGTTELWRERSFAVVLSDRENREALWSGAFDRVVLKREKDRLHGAELLDFKTDRIGERELDERVAFYRPQLAGYRRVLAHMTGLAESTIETKMVFLHLDEVRAL